MNLWSRPLGDFKIFRQQSFKRLGFDGFAVSVEDIVSDPSKRFVCSLRWLVGSGCRGVHSCFAVFGGKFLSSLQKNFPDARASCRWTHKQVIKRIDRPSFYRTKSGIKLTEANDLFQFVGGKKDYGLSILEAIMNEASGHRLVRFLRIELPVCIEQWCEDV